MHNKPMLTMVYSAQTARIDIDAIATVGRNLSLPRVGVKSMRGPRR